MLRLFDQQQLKYYKISFMLQKTKTQRMRLVKTAAIILKNDIKSCMSNNDTYPSSEDILNTD